MLKPGLVYTGSQINIAVNFQDNNGTNIDPATVVFKLLSPHSVSPPFLSAPSFTTYTYGVDPQLTKQSVGNYTALVTPDVAGRWRYRWESTGTGTTTATEGDFLVQQSFFTDTWLSGDYA